MNKITFLLGLCTLVILSSCDPARVYEKNIDFENRIWRQDSISSFSFIINDTTLKYNLFYAIRNSVDYPYHNLYINYTLKDSMGNVLSTELNDASLFNPKTGKPKGEGLGDVFDHRILFLENFRFSQLGEHHIDVQQFMRTDSLSEIMSFGIRVEKKENP